MKRPRPTGGNENFQELWDKYAKEFAKAPGPLMLPIRLDIDGIVKRSRIRSQAKSGIDAYKLQELTGRMGDPAARLAYDSYIEFYDRHDANETPPLDTVPGPLDVSVIGDVVYIFYLDRENWTFTEGVQFTVDNIDKAEQHKAFKVIGTFDGGRGLMVHRYNWRPGNAERFRMKFNLHVSIHQNDGTDTDPKWMRTDIIIDPGENQGGKGGGG